MSRFSQVGKDHPEWKKVNTNLYTPILQAIFNIAQRSMLLGDTRGLKGIRKLTGLNENQVMEIYELMLEGNTTHPLIVKNLNAKDIFKN